MHPEFNFVFTIQETAVSLWGYTPERAAELQSGMVAVVCTHAKKLDEAKGLRILIRDETCEPVELDLGLVEVT